MFHDALTGRAGESVRVLDADSGLAEALGADAALAREHLRARVIRVPQGRWRAQEDPRVPDRGFGLLVLDGLLVRRVALAGRRCAELLGPGDLLRPRQESEVTVLPGDASFRAIRATRLAVLDARFAARAAHWPDLAGALVGRAMARARTLAEHLALAQIPGVEVRLLALLWQLAERWGTVTPEGVVLPLRVSHELLGELVGARRPTVTTALSALVRRGALERRRDRSWLLPGEPPEFDEPPARAAAPTGAGRFGR